MGWFTIIFIFFHANNPTNISCKVLMRDELNKIKSTKKNNIIMNLQTSKDNGSHWVALFRTDNVLRSAIINYYFDPYGVLPTKEVYNYFRSFGSSEQPLIYKRSKYNNMV